MLFVPEDFIRKIVKFPTVLRAVEGAFVALDGGKSKIFEVVRGSGSDPSHFFGIKAALDGSTGSVGVKAGSYHPANLKHGRPSHTSTTLLVNDETAELCAVVEANYLNGLRTSAANAAAAKFLARPDSETLSVIGSGSQALFEMAALTSVLDFKTILVGGRDALKTRTFAKLASTQLKCKVEAVSIEEAARKGDVIALVTSATEPVIETAWISAGTHIAAMGADNVGKQELPEGLITDTLWFVDFPEQAVVIGETQHAFKAGLTSMADLQDATLGALLSGRAKGRTDDRSITVFDSSGTAVQDIAAAAAAFHAYRELPRSNLALDKKKKPSQTCRING
ncbi:MAG: ornithine cyclodeaminase family protein [Pseudomonadota bacterium]